VVVVHPLSYGCASITWWTYTNQFASNKMIRDHCLRCNWEACINSLAGQKAILKVEVSCLRKMSLQFKCCMPGCTKNVRSKGPLQHYKIARCRTNIDIILLNFLQTHSKLTEVYLSMASLNHQQGSIRLYLMEHADDARKFLDWKLHDFTGYVFKENKLLIF